MKRIWRKRLIPRLALARSPEPGPGISGRTLRDLTVVGATAVPPLNVALTSTNAILDLIENNRVHQAQMKRFAAHLRFSMSSIVEHLDAGRPTAISEAAHHLASVLQHIHIDIQRLTGRSRFKRLLRVQQDSKLLNAWREELDRAVQAFHIEATLAIDQVVVAMAAETRSSGLVLRQNTTRVDELDLKVANSTHETQRQVSELKALTETTTSSSSRNYEQLEVLHAHLQSLSKEARAWKIKVLGTITTVVFLK